MEKVPSRPETFLSHCKMPQYCRVIFASFLGHHRAYFSSPKTIISGQILMKIYLILPLVTEKVVNGIACWLLCPFALACCLSQPRMHLKTTKKGFYSSTNHLNEWTTVSQHPHRSNNSDGIPKYLKALLRRHSECQFCCRVNPRDKLCWGHKHASHVSCSQPGVLQQHPQTQTVMIVEWNGWLLSECDQKWSKNRHGGDGRDRRFMRS